MQVLHNSWGRRLVWTCVSIFSIAIISAGIFAVSQATAADETAAPASAPVETGSKPAPTTKKKTSKPKPKRKKAKVKVKVHNRHLAVGESTVVRGKVRPAGTRRKVTVRIGSHKFVTRTKKKNGKFKVRVGVPAIGDRQVTVRVGGDRFAKGKVAKRGRLVSYRTVHASYFGPGLYGGGMACGGRLTPGTHGVAHKTLPCGTKLTLRLGNRVVRTTVVDRGPFIPGRELDLTTATRNALGMGDLAMVQMSHS